jgi:hypothetical protein
MTVSTEIDKIRDAIREVEDPSAAMALRHVYKALEELREEVGRLKNKMEPSETTSDQSHH